MSAPVFGREPSRPLPRDADSEPSGEIDLMESRSGNEHNHDDADPTDPMGVALEDGEADRPEEAERDEAVDREVAERDEADEPARGGPEVVVEGDERDEPEAEGDDADTPDVSEVAERGADEPEAEGEGDEADTADVADGEADEPEVPVGFKLAEGFEAAEPGADEAGASGYPAVGDTDTAPESPVVGSEVVPVVVEAEGVSAEPEAEDAGPDASEMWIEIQAQFVDDPQAATAGALRMLRERLDRLAPAGASTEDLRVAFRRYRAAYFDLTEK